MLSLFVSCLILCGTLVQDVQAKSLVASILEKRQTLYNSGESKISKDEKIHRREFFKYVTRPDIDAPRWNVKTYDKEALTPGFWFTATYEYVSQKKDDHRRWIGPHIYDQQGELIWSGAPMFKGYNLKDFRVQMLKGQPVMTGVYVHDGIDAMVNNHYEFTDYQLPFRKPNVNLHDFNLAPLWNGTRAIRLTLDRYKATREESKSVGYKKGKCSVVTTGIHEYDTTTWEKTFEWSGEGKIFINESYLDTNCGPRGRWDFIHANAVDKFPDGDFLLSGRHTDTLYKISHKDGHIVWRLGGKTSDWKVNGHFSGQHHARVQSQNSTHIVLTFLDNAIRPGEPHTTNDQSRGMIMSLRTDRREKVAEVIKVFNHPDHDYSPGRGSFQMLSNGNAFLGWWMKSLISEHSPDDKVLMEASWVAELKSYRSFKHEWVGYPKAPPDVHAESVMTKKDGLTTAVYVSWNGATEQTHWKLYSTSADGKERKHILTSPRQGFETLLVYKGYSTYVMVEGLDKNGDPLGHSAVIKTIEPSSRVNPAIVEAGLVDPSEHQETGSWTAVASDALTHPAAIFVGGFFACGTIILVIWIVMRMRARKHDNHGPRWQKQSGRPYKSKQLYDAVSGSMESLTEINESDHDVEEKSSG